MMMRRLLVATAPRRSALHGAHHNLHKGAAHQLFFSSSSSSPSSPSSSTAPSSDSGGHFLHHHHHHHKFVGAHISASGGCLMALQNAQQQLGPRARSFAFFVRPRLSWKPVSRIDEEIANEFQKRLACSQFDADQVVVHGSYIINFGSHDAQLRAKSVELMVEEVTKCMQLGIPSYVFHPGSCTRVPEHLAWPKKPRKGESPEALEEARAKEAVARAQSVGFIADCMAQVLSSTQYVTLCIENMCGQGNVLGRNFQELREILDAVVSRSASSATRLGVCLDTCHLHASGVPLHTVEDCEQMMRCFNETMGPKWREAQVLKVIHVNDSMDLCGAKKDRHENIGLGKIGLTAFEWLMNSPHFDHLPLILETPRRGDEAMEERWRLLEDGWEKQKLRAFVGTDSDANEIELLLGLVR